MPFGENYQLVYCCCRMEILGCKLVSEMVEGLNDGRDCELEV